MSAGSATHGAYFARRRGRKHDDVTDPDVRAYLGGAQSRAAFARDLDEAGVPAATDSAGSFVIADRHTDAFLGTVSLTRRGVHRPGHLRPCGEELELAYTLNRPFWGRGVAYQAASAVLGAAAVELPDEPVIIVTQSANARSLNLARRLGFEPVMTFEEFDAQQTLAVASLHGFRPQWATR
ncbi:GNAT family N-acetyltransferase [Mycolicibacterium hodleri]|uniref:N-acetyltransferase n=1 Tax=Mycolicibacterium hodleri TaxID=49897 RepID=A0A502DJB6_9MYCO|nr:GNAT family N-acetyltransferase [Mycolicibacterium hodleri]TPG25617.1 N-acetyltransferase [Mycolicibacterium hodleri]